MSSTAIPPEPPLDRPHLKKGAAPGEKGLDSHALNFRETLAIGLDSTAPAYSLAAVIGILVVGVGTQAPAVLLVAFIPMFLTSLAYAALNRADPDCGTTFSWVTRSMGPFMGWFGGWAVSITGILVIGSLADTAASYTYLLLGMDDTAVDKTAVCLLAVGIIVLMTALTVVGTHVTGLLQAGLVTLQISGLLIFAVVALVKVLGDDAGPQAIDPSLSWLNPFDISFSALAAGMLTAVFIYWGWESAITVNEENEESLEGPGRAGVLSTVILVATYVLVAFAVISYAGLDGVAEFEDDIGILASQAEGVLGSPLDQLVVLAVLVSALASTQTTILPASRTLLSMSRRGAFPEALGRVHPRFRTPHVATILIAVLATAYYVPFKLGSENFLFDTITALGLCIALYYALTGFACAIFYRHRFKEGLGTTLKLGVGPVIGGLVLSAIFVKAVNDFSIAEDSYSGEILGISPPLLIGGVMLGLGVVGALIWKAVGDPEFWAEKPTPWRPGQKIETVAPEDGV